MTVTGPRDHARARAQGGVSERWSENIRWTLGRSQPLPVAPAPEASCAFLQRWQPRPASPAHPVAVSPTSSARCSPPPGSSLLRNWGTPRVLSNRRRATHGFRCDPDIPNSDRILPQLWRVCIRRRHSRGCSLQSHCNC